MRKTSNVLVWSIASILLLASLSGVALTTQKSRYTQVTTRKMNTSSSSDDVLTYSYSFKEPEVERTELANEMFAKVTMDGAMAIGAHEGAPSLPVHSIKLLLPQNTALADINVVADNQVKVDTGDINLSNTPVVPYQHSVPFGHKKVDDSTVVDKQIYESRTPISSSLYDNVNTGYCRGYNILSLDLHPVEYLPAEGVLFYSPEMTIEITLQNTDTVNQFYRNHPSDESWVRSLVSNPEVTQTYGLPERGRAYVGGICNSSENYDYVIITTTHNGLDYWTTDSSTPYNWTSLMDKHQIQDGLSSTIVTKQQINAESDYYNSTSLFNDTEAHIREFCRDAYQDWGTEYILIGGDQEWIPGRLMDYAYESDVESDLYWSNLDKTFNADQDNDWGETGDGGFDKYSELYIGRLPCDEPQDISNWMNKSFYYADSVESDYLDNAAFYGGDTGWNAEGDDFIDYSAIKGTNDWLGPNPHNDGPFPSWAGFQYGFETWNANAPEPQEFNLSVKWTAEPTNPGWQGGSESAATGGLETDINNDQVTLISGIAHANEDMSLDVYASSWESDYHNTKPFFIHDYGCHCGDMNAADDGVLHSMLFHSDTELSFGAVYNTGYGWGNDDSTNSSSAFQQKAFWDYMFDTTNNSGSIMNWQLGKAHAWSKDLMAPTIGWDTSTGTWRGIVECCLLFGDPAQRIKPPIQPDHELVVNDLEIPSTVPHGETQYVRATITNAGKNNESNLQVNFTVNGTVMDSTIINSLPKLQSENVNFSWNPDNGTYLVGIEVEEVPGENFTFNNHQNKTVEVIPVPDIWISPQEFDFFVNAGETDTSQLTVGNDADAEAALNFNVSISGGSSWLSVTPNSGTVSLGGSMDIDVSVDATGMTEGTYQDTLVITCNDLDESELEIPITLHVTYGEDMGVESINTPSDVEWAGNTIVNATVFNYGSLDQTDVPVKCTIYEGILNYTEDFEEDNGGYTHAVGPGPGSIDDWEWGSPTSGPNSGHSGTNCWATNLDGDHSNGADSVLNSITVDLSKYPQPQLRFYHWADVTVYDCGNVKISTDGGNTWNLITPQGGYPGTADDGNQGIPNEPAFTDDTSGWEEVIFDLSSYSSDTVKIRWHFGATDVTPHPGWYIDDVNIESTLARDVGDIIYTDMEYVDVNSYSGKFVEFTPAWNPSVGNYTVQVSTQLPGDKDDSNNQTATTTWIQEPPQITVDFSLSEGWNLITVPVANNFTASSLGQNIPSCSIVAQWDTSENTFDSFLVGTTPPSQAFDIKDGVGYFVYVENDVTFSVTGMPISNVSVSLNSGWNMIGWYKDTPTDASSLGQSINHCSIVAQWDASENTFDSFLVGTTPPPGFTINQGIGLFVYVDSDTIWHGQG